MRHISAGVAALALSSGGAQALTPIPPCDGIEGGMKVHSAAIFGYDGSGFVVEHYTNLDSADGVIGGADGPVPQLNDFLGFRVTDCRSGKFVAVDGVFGSEPAAPMLATEFLRNRVRQARPIQLGHVQKAAKALYGHDDYTRALTLRETEETCACREFYPGLWAN